MVRSPFNSSHSKCEGDPKTDDRYEIDSTPTLPEIGNMAMSLLMQVTDTETKRKGYTVGMRDVIFGTQSVRQVRGFGRSIDIHGGIDHYDQQLYEIIYDQKVVHAIAIRDHNTSTPSPQSSRFSLIHPFNSKAFSMLVTIW